ncbi:MAG: Asp-tRNA(Asn)/Glu-tRNA(Gln) amidotransferase subunit GatA [Candidatus Sungbacteria bacterium]|nr:Asp-tRNA(Asn)/Glu-tRNA(Gln) amidotransferase subunit GatA [Candidatus Sungbacteria bacterium]
MNLNELTIKQISEGYRKQEFLPSDVVSACLEAIRKKDGEIHAFLEVSESAWEEAKQADTQVKNGNALPQLFGVPMALKDNIFAEGTKTTAGSRMLKDYRAPYSATVVQKLKNHGAIIIGKTNMDEFAMGSSTENSAFGPAKNPHDTSRVPGGSSGGSAAAVAAHFVPAALGSDTGGSIRQPASFCGIAGFKPSYGAVSRHGLIAMASSLDQIGPMAKTVKDTEILFRAIAGKDVFDATTAPVDSEVHEKALKDTVFGIPREYMGEGLDPEVEAVIRNAIKKLEQAGAAIKEISLPNSSSALPAYYIIVPSEVSTNLARFESIRYGHRNHEAKTLFETYTKSRSEGFGAEVKRRVMLGTYALSAGYYEAYYVKAQKVRSLIREDFSRAFVAVDYIIGPTTPTPAFHFGAHKDNPLAMYLADVYTVAVNLAGNPSLSLNAGFAEEEGKKLPIGLQVIAPFMKDLALLNTAVKIEDLLKSAI